MNKYRAIYSQSMAEYMARKARDWRDEAESSVPRSSYCLYEADYHQREAAMYAANARSEMGVR